MRTRPTDKLAPDRVQRARCYVCFRPKETCFCDAIPRVDNKTDVLILQHVRERFHPFNTARIVHRALRNSTLLVDQTSRLAAAKLPLKPRCGLLYPGPGGRLISDLPPDGHPSQLVILDGTWNHVKTLMRDISALHDLPRYRLAPASPGRYRIRREPNDTSLSTLEATVAALLTIEPDTAGLNELLQAFNTMVERQLAHPKAEYGARSNTKRDRTLKNIPRALLGDLRNVVVAYGESAAGERGRKRIPQPPIYWVAQRLESDERFARAIRPQSPLRAAFLEHLELTEHDFAGALSPEEFRACWASFLRPGDSLVVYSQSTARLLTHIRADLADCLVLKSVNFHPTRRCGTLDKLLAAEGLTASAARHPGRAGKRLANAITLVRHLNTLGNAKFRRVRLEAP